MNLKEFKEQLKKAKVTQDKYAYIVTDNFYLTSDKTDALINKHEDSSEEIINIAPNGFIVITPYAKGLYSDKFLNEISKTEIELIKLDFLGNPVWGFYPASRTLANLVKSQILLTTEKYDNLRAELIVDLVEDKITSEQLTLNKAKMKKLDSSGSMEKWIQNMMTTEGQYALEYWNNFKKQNDILEDFSRATEKYSKGNIKAQDHVNALLNLGYGILAHKITFALYQNGLDPTVGFYHKIKAKGQRYSLTWDLIEPSRYIIDNILLKHINEINTDDFETSVKEDIKYLTLRDIQHKVGRVPYKLKYKHDNPYKKWINIFTKELHKTDITLWISKYKLILAKVMVEEKIGKNEESEEIVKSVHVKEAKDNIKYLQEKLKKTKIPKISEQTESLKNPDLIQGNLDKKIEEPEQEKDIVVISDKSQNIKKLKKIITKK